MESRQTDFCEVKSDLGKNAMKSRPVGRGGAQGARAPSVFLEKRS